MFLFFDKEFRQFESILSDLMTKVKKSDKFAKKYDRAYEIYDFDMVGIYLHISSNTITVKDKSGNEIISLDCRYDRSDKLQNAKWHQFGGFLSAVRAAYDKHIEKAEKMKKTPKKCKKRNCQATTKKCGSNKTKNIV